MRAVVWVLLTALAALAADGQRVNAAYFYNGDGRTRGYYPKDIATSGAAARITHLLYAFGNPTANGCALSDPEADSQKAFDAPNSVDGRADSADPHALPSHLPA